MTPPEMKTLREALQKVLDVAKGDTTTTFMSIPARPDVDADLLLAAALDELEAARARIVVIDAVAEPAAKTSTRNDRFFAGPDDESFHATSPEEYLRDKFDGGVLDKALADAVDGVVVAEFRRRPVTPEWVSGRAELLLEAFDLAFADEYGGEDDDCYAVHRDGADNGAEAERELCAALARHVARNLRPWQCEEVSRRTYTRDEVAVILGSAARDAQPVARVAATIAPVEVTTFTKPEPR